MVGSGGGRGSRGWRNDGSAGWWDWGMCCCRCRRCFLFGLGRGRLWTKGTTPVVWAWSYGRRDASTDCPFSVIHDAVGGHGCSPRYDDDDYGANVNMVMAIILGFIILKSSASAFDVGPARVRDASKPSLLADAILADHPGCVRFAPLRLIYRQWAQN